MNGEQIKKAAINKVKAVASAASPSANGQKKRRQGQDLKPIITHDGPGAGSTARAQRCVLLTLMAFFYIFILVYLACPTPHIFSLEHISMIPLVIVLATVKDA